VRTYDDLRKTQAEVELQTKLRSVEPLHKSSNAASLKVEAARQEIPEVPSQSPSGQVQEPQTPEPEPVLPWKVRYDADERDLQTRKADYAEAIKTEDFERKETMDKEIVGRMKENGYTRDDIADFKRLVDDKHLALIVYARTDESLTQRERHNSFSKEEKELEGQYKWEQTQVKMAQNRGERPAARSGQDGPNRPGQAPEKPVRTQEPPRVAAATPDGRMVAQEREAMQRGSRPQRLEPQTAPEAAKAPEKPEQSKEPTRAAPTEAAPDAGKRKLVFYEDRNAPTPEHQIKR
jgi:hypothetical protein